MTEQKPIVSIDKDRTDLAQGVAVVNVNESNIGGNDTADQFRAHLAKAILKLTQQAEGKKFTLVLDMSPVHIFSSTNLQAVLNAQKNLLGTQGNRLLLTSVNPHVHVIFTGITHTDEIVPTTQEKLPSENTADWVQEQMASHAQYRESKRTASAVGY